jgi:hypothetical protein
MDQRINSMEYDLAKIKIKASVTYLKALYLL